MIEFNKQELEEDWILEEFIWHVDMKDVYNEETYQYSKDFVKSLGLESDCIGWCTLKPRVDESIVKQIYRKAKEEKVRILAKYELNLTKNYPTDWYILTGNASRKYSNAIKDRIIDLEDDFCIVQRISGYKIAPSDRILAGRDFLIFQKSVVDFLKENEINDLDYMWVEDFGKYRATPYFFAMPKAFLTWCFDDEMYDLHKGRGKKEMSNQICAFGKKIELIWKKSKVLRMNFPIMVRRQELQGRDIWRFGRELLVSKKVRNLFIQNKLVDDRYFKPVFVSDRDIENPPRGLGVTELSEYFIPGEVQQRYRKLYEKDLSKNKSQIK